MKQLIKLVGALVENEYFKAAVKYGPLHCADHQSVAVLAEEVDETRDELARVVDKCQELWKLVKQDAADEQKIEVLKSIQTKAVLAACEAIQVAAMAYKAELTINARGETKV